MLAWMSFYSHASYEAWRCVAGRKRYCQCFYSHASCEAWRKDVREPLTTIVFLLTCLLRGMTCKPRSKIAFRQFLLTCLLRGMTPVRYVWLHISQVSTHMPLARHDSIPICSAYSSAVSTHMPLARHDCGSQWTANYTTVSTHMPLARHDLALTHPYISFFCFYSHASCEAWPPERLICCRIPRFLLTCLLRGMTHWHSKVISNLFVSTHMPLARHDWTPFYNTVQLHMFLLTCLLRGMTILQPLHSNIRNLVSTHMPLARHDCVLTPDFSLYTVSTHMPLARHDIDISITHTISISFLLTCLLRGMTVASSANVMLGLSFYSHASYEAWHGRIWSDRGCYCFYSHASYEAWLSNPFRLYVHRCFYSHASYEAWLPLSYQRDNLMGFYSHASYEAWRCILCKRYVGAKFLLTCLLRGMTKTAIEEGEKGKSFYSHASYEAWHWKAVYMAYVQLFLLTCLLRGMTRFPPLIRRTGLFLLTCLLRGMTLHPPQTLYWD